MFGSLSSLTKAAVGALVEVPVAVVSDVVTLGGSLTDEPEPYTATALGKVKENVANATDPE